MTLEEELDRALSVRNNIIDSMLGLREYAHITLKRQALARFMLDGHQEQDMPINLRKAQARVLELLGEE